MSQPIEPTREFQWGDIFALMGREILTFVALVGGVTQLAGQTLRATWRYRWDVREIVRQCFFVGNRSMPIVLLIGAFTGMVLSLQFVTGLARFGLQLYTGQIVGLALTRELGPVLTSIMVAARVGSGIAAELGSMMVTEQVMAIEAMGANPIHKLVVPRTIATVIATPFLAVFADAVGVLGGMVITCMEVHVTPDFFMNQIWSTISMGDYLHGLAKTLVFAFSIAQIACYQGLTTYGGTAGVGQSTTRAVVYACVVIFISDFFLTKLLIIF